MTASELVAEIGDRFARGDSAPEHTARLGALVASIELMVARAGALPGDLRDELTGLLARVQAATMTGGRWLDEAASGPALANLLMRARVEKAYGVSPRDDSPT